MRVVQVVTHAPEFHRRTPTAQPRPTRPRTYPQTATETRRYRNRSMKTSAPSSPHGRRCPSTLASGCSQSSPSIGRASGQRLARGGTLGRVGWVGAKWTPARRDAPASLHGQLAGIGKRDIRCIRESGWRRLQPTGIGRRAAGDRARGELQGWTFQSALTSPPNAAPKGDTPNADSCRAASNADDSDLSAIVAAWPTLPEHARARVLGIIAEYRAR